MVDLRTKLYQMFILGTDGEGYKQALSYGLGGIIFFTDDIKTSEQFKGLIKEIKSQSLISPFLSIDQEGGRVERTINIHNGKKYLSAKYAYEKGLEFLRNQTAEIAKELNSYGINLNFAPCIDVNTNPSNPIIGERAFSSEPDKVIEAQKIVIKEYETYKIIPCVKHFPGHGDTNKDSHLTLPVINLTLEEMEELHIKPFKEAIKFGIDMIMVAHIHCTCFNKEPIPTSLSNEVINYLRKNLSYEGVIVSDDMVMKGVQDFGQVEAIIKGINAGLNMFIYRNSNPETIKSIEKAYEIIEKDNKLIEKINQSYEKIMKLKYKYL